MRQFFRDNGLILTLLALLAVSISGAFIEVVFENWQSGSLSIAVIVVLAIVLRQKGSPEPKPVADPHSTTGTS